MNALSYALIAWLIGLEPPLQWTVLFDATGQCSFAVPPDWHVDNSVRSSVGVARSKDGRATATLIRVDRPLVSIEADLRTAPLKPIVVERSTHRLTGEYTGGWPGIHHIAGTEDEAGSCVLYIDSPAKPDHALDSIIDAVAATTDSVR